MIKREAYLNKILKFKDDGFVKILTGVRRSGKTFILMMIKEEMLKMGINDDRFIYINYEDNQNKLLTDGEILHAYIENALKDKDQYYLFIDEIQEINEWAKVINSLRSSFNVDIYVTGSNSRVFIGENLTYLAGRYVNIDVYPLSFKEFLYFTKQKATVDAYNKFLESSFPLLALEKDTFKKNLYEKDLIASIIYRDVILRNETKDELLLTKILTYTMNNVGNLMNIKKITDSLNSSGTKVSYNTVEKYVSNITKSYILYFCPRYDIRSKDVFKTNGKYYAVDLGIRKKIISDRALNLGFTLENFIFLELKKNGYDVFIGVTRNSDKEIDFVAIKNEEKMYVQVSFSVMDEKTLKREVEPFASLRDNYPRYLVTFDEFDFSAPNYKHLHVFEFLKTIQE